MGHKVIGFIGIDKYEYIMYLSRVLHHLEKKVLLIDYSESEALRSCIPTLKSPVSEVIEYRGIKFLNGKLEALNGDYDCVLIDFGMNNKHPSINQCDHLVYVTDLQLHNIDRLYEVPGHKEIEKSLIIKDICACKLKPRYAINTINLTNLSPNNILAVSFDYIDYKCKITCQCDDVFQFKKISIQTKNAVIKLVSICCDIATNKELMTAYNKAKKGE